MRSAMRFAMQFAAAAGLALGLTACAGAPRAAEDPAGVQVMVLGVWHFGNPGRDFANVASADVLTPARQAELARVAQAMAAFRPTVVVVERITPAPDYVDPRFAEFDGSQLASERNERVQLAYRVARAAGVVRVYGADEQPADDEPDYFPFEKLQQQAEATGQSRVLEQALADAQGMTQRFSERQAGRTMAALLLETNTGELASPAFYYAMARLDRGESQAGAELNAYWFMRNAKIFSKIAQVTRPGDRVLVVYGAGHKHWLDHLAANTPGFASVDPAPYLRRAMAAGG